MRKKGSFFAKLTGAINADEHDDFDAPLTIEADDTEAEAPISVNSEPAEVATPEPEAEAELTVDVHQTAQEIVIETIVAGTTVEDLDVAITREMVTISGARHKKFEVSDSDYFHQELFWGSFSRNILLPEEIDVDTSRAKIKDGILTIHMPKVDKNRKTKLEIQMG